MRRPVFLKGFISKPTHYHRPQEESFEWLAWAHARAAVTASGREDKLEEWKERIRHRLTHYSCSPEFIGWRGSEIADYMHTDWEKMRIFNLHENPSGRGLGVRNEFYAETASQIVKALFEDDLEPPSDVLHVSCTGYVSPSAVQRLIEQKRWNSFTRSAQVYHMGCYAALPALRIAEGLLSLRPETRRRADIVHTELCTLHFDPSDHSAGQLIVQTLFSDGHIRYSVAFDNHREIENNDGTFEILASLEEIVPDSLEEMTWILSDWGFQMTLSKDVPGKIATSLPKFLSALFADAGLGYSDEAGEAIFAVHPGGPKILDSIEELLGLNKRQLRLSRKVLFERGNMSSATLPHIWMEAASDSSIKSGTLVASLGFGPGLTIAGTLFRKC